jgi:hypothetical protein
VEIAFIAGDQRGQPGTGETTRGVVEAAIQEGGFVLGGGQGDEIGGVA